MSTTLEAEQIINTMEIVNCLKIDMSGETEITKVYKYTYQSRTAKSSALLKYLKNYRRNEKSFLESARNRPPFYILRDTIFFTFNKQTPIILCGIWGNEIYTYENCGEEVLDFLLYSYLTWNQLIPIAKSMGFQLEKDMPGFPKYLAYENENISFKMFKGDGHTRTLQIGYTEYYLSGFTKENGFQDGERWAYKSFKCKSWEHALMIVKSMVDGIA